jgi:MFS family permease
MRVFWPMMAILCVLGFTNLFLRSSFGVMAPHLASEMRLSPVELSAVASSFFFAYALMQVPTGVLLDRFGPRRTLATMLLFTLAGTALFAAASSGVGLAVGRVLMGIGCAGVFTGAFYVLAVWLPKERVVTASGVLNSFASFGNLTSTTPLAILIAWIGWRQSYWLFTAGVGVLLAGVALYVRDRPPGATPQAARADEKRGENLSEVLRGVGSAVRQPGLWRLLVVGFPMSAASTIAGAWGAPYLRDVHGLDDIARGNVLFAMALCGLSGHMLFGYMARLVNSSKAAIITGAIGIIAATLCLSLLVRPPLWLVTVLFCLLGISGSYPTVAMAHARGLVPPHLMGRGVSVTNMGVMLAVASMQFVFGWVVGLYPGEAGLQPEPAYRAAFAVQAGVAALALAVYLPVRDARPKG